MVTSKAAKKPAKKKAPKKRTPAEKKPALRVRVDSGIGDEFIDHFGKHLRTNMCCRWRFPTFSVLLLAVGLIWLFSEMGYIAVNIPWLPVLLILLAFGIIVNSFMNR